MRAGDLLRDLAERRIGLSCIIKAVLRHDDRVCPAPPFPHEPRPRPDAWVGIGNNASFCVKFFGQYCEFPLRGFAEATIGDLLQVIGEGADKQVAAQPWRVAPV